MARVAGIDLHPNKRIDVALTYIYGVGRKNVGGILQAVQIPGHLKVKDLDEAQLSTINAVLSKDYRVEGELRREIESNISRYVEVGSYRGQRHRRNLPARGQRTRTNARTRRGMRRTVGSVKPGIALGAAKPATATAAPAAKK
ncbi:MAG: 30S ribosomal protein S13 [Elusimicrobia bacterium]|nr:30S ribosomal protein S13 [Elusimicrobiota bacterium]